MPADPWLLYRHMLKSRLFEQAVSRLWEEGRISGEMHLGIGEEAIAAGIVTQLADGDALALDHRATPPLLVRGVDPVLLLREFLGRPDGLCAGAGGHMHLFSPQHLAASSGIVGASGPAAVGFALAAQRLRPGALAVAFFGEGAVNQGMLLESLNLAAAWRLPVLFVCKDSGWAISTPSPSVTAGSPVDRALGFGMPAAGVDGADAQAVWDVARDALQRARADGGPTFLHARCAHPEGHFLGDPLVRMARHPLVQLLRAAGPMVRSLARLRGASLRERVAGVRAVVSLLGTSAGARPSGPADPLDRARRALPTAPDRLQALEAEVRVDIHQIVDLALRPVGSAPASGA